MDTPQSTTLPTENTADIEAVRGPFRPSIQATADTEEASPLVDFDNAHVVYPLAPAGGSVVPLPTIHPFMYAPSFILPHGMIQPECILWLSGPEELTALEETATMDNTVISNIWHVDPELSHHEGTRTPSPIDNALAHMLIPFPETASLHIEDEIDAFLWQAAVFDATPEVILEQEQLTA